MGAVDIHPMAIDNSWQYRPQESPAKCYITGGAGDAGGILRGLVWCIGAYLRPVPWANGYGVLKAALDVPVADEQPLDDPEGLTGCHKP
jgi:hypothetical protein